MKPLEYLTHADRAKLLFELFPDDIAAFIGFAEDIINEIIDKPGTMRKVWQENIIQFELGQQLAPKARAIIDKYGKRLSKEATLFSDQLFDGLLAVLLIYCLLLYKKVCRPNRFTLAIQLFFIENKTD